MTGLASKETMVIATPDNINVSVPFPKLIPPAINEVRYKQYVSIIKCRKIRFIFIILHL